MVYELWPKQTIFWVVSPNSVRPAAVGHGSSGVLWCAIVYTCCAENVENHSLPLFGVRRVTAIYATRPKLTGVLKS